MAPYLNDLAGYLSRPAHILKGYQSSYLRPDMMAGLTTAVVLLPQAITYALIAELPAQTGLYAAIFAAIFGALWGSSSHLHTGPTNAASLLVLSTLITFAAPGSPEYIAAAGLMAVMVGIVRLLMGVARLGVIVNFVSDSVVIGFTAGAGVLISINQLRHLLNINISSNPNLLGTLVDLAGNINQTHLPSLGIGLMVIILMFLMKQINPKWPGALITILLAAGFVALINPDKTGISVLGELPRSLPPLASLPWTDFALISKISTGALAISAIGLVEAMSIARSIAAQTGERINSNQEFVGQGMANIAAGIFSGYTCSGSFTRSAVIYTSGGKTHLASVFSGLWVLGAVLIFAPLTVYIPRAALAGALVVTAIRMVDKQEMVRIWHSSRGDSLIMISTLLATLFLPLEFAVLSGMVISFARYIIKTSTPEVFPVIPGDDYGHMVPQQDKPPCPQLSVISIGGSLYFGATHHIEDRILDNLKQYPEQKYLLLRMQLVDISDISGIHMLEAVVRQYRKRGGDVYFVGVREQVMGLMKSVDFYKYVGSGHFLDREEAISHLFHKVLDPSVCIYECDRRIFAECQALPKFPYDAKSTSGVELAEHHVPQWYPSEVRGLIDNHPLDKAEEDTPLLVDVRENSEYARGHVAGTVLLPLKTIPIEGFGLPKDRPIILICRSGRRSNMAAAILQDMGYNNVYNMRGGMLAWEAAGYPIAVE